MRQRTLVQIAFVGLVVGGLAGWLALAHGPNVGVAGPLLDVAIGLSFVACGLALLRLRAGDVAGRLLTLIGFGWLVQLLRVTDISWAATLGWVFNALPLAGLVILALTFPGGQLATRLDHVLAVIALGLAGVLQIAWLLVLPALPGCESCVAPPSNALLIHPREGIALGIEIAQNSAGAALGLTVLSLLVRRWRLGSPALRRRVAPVLWVGAAMCAAGAVALVNEIGGTPLGDAPWWVLSVLFMAMPLAVASAQVQQRLGRAEVASLVIELGRQPSSRQFREALARTLGDPGLEVLFWLPDGRRYVDLDGRAAALPEDDARAVSPVEHMGERIGALVHDQALCDDPDLVRSVSAAAALSLQNQRLQVELLARARDLEESRARLVEAGDRERRRIERDLHDGAQQRLVSASMALGLARARDHGSGIAPLLGEAQEQLEQALRELRELSHGLLPPLLRERGLEDALRELAKRSPVPTDFRAAGLPTLPSAAAAALYFIAAEALTNVVKHARATRVDVDLREYQGGTLIRISDDGVGGADPEGNGLRGLADRAAALGGKLVVRRRHPRGTVVEGWVPCDSS